MEIRRSMTSSQDLFAPSQDTLRQSVTISAMELAKLGMPKGPSSQFMGLRKSFLQKVPTDWTKVHPPPDSFFHPHSSLKDVGKERAKEILSKLVVIQLNGGLGLRMGCNGAKSGLQILKKAGYEEPLTFLDCKVMHIEELNREYDVDIPLVLMNSFNTEEETLRRVQKYKSRKVTIKTFNQNKFPLMFRDTLAMVASSESEDEFWYPPGSGDVFKSLDSSGLLAEFRKEGKEYIFISNVENLGATVDAKILDHFINESLDFLLEVTNRISTDKGGGFPIQFTLDDRVHILETSQIPFELLSNFSLSTYKYWNTNNLWVRLKPVANLVQMQTLKLDFIVKVRTVKGRNVVQLETPAAMAIHNFKKSAALHVPRDRYRPVKTTSELLQAQSDLYELHNGRLVMNPARIPATEPLVKLGEEFSTLEQYEKRFASIPNILELDHLTVSGDVRFGANITLKGTVIIVADTGSSIYIPDGTILENKIVAGDLLIQDY
eukprot:TRINITY_DN4632_c0_g1_i1.p1 TRINITY_DN4632_c0_g1~~TRINITY_DN4632_c0_g1_i1.p1  ORF type:complete len:491 (-),score=114.56 TRINITY_DN4632_c0_g1_i1:6-1478(-)